MNRLALLVVLAAMVAFTTPAQKPILDAADVRSAVEEGLAKKPAGLALSTLDSLRCGVEIYTPREWVKKQAANAAKELRPFKEADADTRPVLHVVALPGTPRTIAEASYVCQVRRAVLRDTSKKEVVQPTFEGAIGQAWINSLGAETATFGRYVEFSLDELQMLRSKDPNQEFFVTIVTPHGTEFDFKVKKKHFSKLP